MAAQVPDKILYEGERLDLYSNPLEQFWTSARKARPPFIPTTECSRGYIASWEIRNNKLLLTAIEGKLRLPIGSMIRYEHSGYDSRFEKEYIITVHEGEVVKMVTIDFKEKSLVINLETPVE